MSAAWNDVATYGYDAPDALLMFAALGAANLVAAIAASWTHGGPRGAASSWCGRKAHYAKTLHALGATGVARRRLGWRFWYGNPFAGTTLVTAAKPSGWRD
jgi:hypothetical protein